MKTQFFTLSATRVLIPSLVSVLAVQQAVAAKKSEAKMNVLVIAVDDMNIWPGAFDGVVKTPNIDKLANSGVKFDNAHCVVPASNPSRTALFTGLRPETTGQYTNQGCFRQKGDNEKLITLPQYLQTSGYHTVSAGKVFHHPRGTTPEPNIYSDPQSWDIQRKGNVGVGSDQHKLYLDENGQAKWQEGAKDVDGYLAKFAVWGPATVSAEKTEEYRNAKFCADYLAQDHDKPFFLSCGVFSPHEPLIAPKEFFDMYPIESIKLPEVPADDMNDIPKNQHRNFSTSLVELIKEKGQWKNAVQGYMAAISFADHTVGVVLDALEKSQYKDNTIVILFSDNGFQLGHKDRWEKYSLWRMATNTPMIMRVPDGEQGVCKRAVSYLDIYPTLLDLLQIEKPDFLQGTTFANLLSNIDAKRETPAVITHGKGNVSVVHENWNLITYADGQQELYDRSNDLFEYKNLIKDAKYKDIVSRLSKYIPTPVK